MKKNPLGQTEFILLIGLMTALVAFSIDSMLPAVPEIGAQLSPDALNRAQLVVPSFFFGMGLGTFFIGPLSDAYGRKPVLIAASAVFIIASLVSWRAASMEMLILSRVVQGLGASGARVIGLAVVRDLYAGRQMARIASFIMIVFAIVPAIAPTIGAGIIYLAGWRAIFSAIALFTVIVIGWFTWRLPETSERHMRTPFRLTSIGHALKELAGSEMFVLCTMVLTLVFGALVATLSSTQQIYDITFGRGDAFPLWFGLTATMAAPVSFINAMLVVRLGMRKLIGFAMIAELIIALVMILMTRLELWPGWAAFPAWFAFSTSIFFMVGLCIGNLNALALEPFGHIAGIAASTLTAISTVLAILIAVPIGQAFDGTPTPLATGAAICAGLGVLVMQRIKKLERVRG